MKVLKVVTGSARMMQNITKECVQEFWKRVDKREPNDCWPWEGYVDPSGYGHFSVHTNDGFRWCDKAPRVSWFLANGEIPKSLCVCHHCDNPRCVNPRHLFVGTQRDNIQDAERKGRMKRNRKLSLEQVRQIKLLLGTRYQKDIAKEFKVSEGLISKIKHRRLIIKTKEVKL